MVKAGACGGNGDLDQAGRVETIVSMKVVRYVVAVS